MGHGAYGWEPAYNLNKMPELILILTIGCGTITEVLVYQPLLNKVYSAKSISHGKKYRLKDQPVKGLVIKTHEMCA